MQKIIETISLSLSLSLSLSHSELLALKHYYKQYQDVQTEDACVHGFFREFDFSLKGGRIWKKHNMCM
jgi:hypothetical protein